MKVHAVRGPSPLLPLAFMALAATAFAFAAVAVPWLAVELSGHYYEPRVLALVHTLTLGWITLTIFGASYQLIPIVLERPIWSERLARAELALAAVGVIGVVAHFAIAEWAGLAWSAALVLAAALVHVLNVALTLRGLSRWSFTARLMALGFGGFTLTAVFGVLLGLEHVRAFLPGTLFARLHAHVHLALLGWVLPVVLGVAARVYPMFLLGPPPGDRVASVQLWGLIIGLPAVVGGLLLGMTSLVVAGALAVAATITAHVVWVASLARASRRPELDWSLRFLLAGAAYLAVTTALGLGLAVDALGGPRWGFAYGVLALGGWASLTIVGMMLKIVPFLVWYRAYAPHAGRMTVPVLADLRWRAAEAVAFVGLAGGVAALALGVALGHVELIRAAGVVVAVGALAFGATLARVLHHLVPRPMRAVVKPS